MCDSFQSPPKPRRFITPGTLPEKKDVEQQKANGTSTSEDDERLTAAISQFQQTAGHYSCPQMNNANMIVPRGDNPRSHCAALRPLPTSADIHPSKTDAVTGYHDNNSSGTKNACISVIEDMEGRVVDRAVSGLPNVLSKMYNMHSGQTDEIHRYQVILHQLQEEITKVEDNNLSEAEQLTSFTTRLYTVHDQSRQSEKHTKGSTAEIKELTLDVYESRKDLERKAEETDADTKKIQALHSRAEKQKEIVTQFELESCPVQKELQETLEHISELEKQKQILDVSREDTELILGGCSNHDVDIEVARLEQQIREVSDAKDETKRKISEEKDEQSQLEKSIQVLQKRHTAHMTRLRRQVKDLQQRSRQWNNQLSQLQQKILEAEKALAGQSD